MLLFLLNMKGSRYIYEDQSKVFRFNIEVFQRVKEITSSYLFYLFFVNKCGFLTKDCLLFQNNIIFVVKQSHTAHDEQKT